MPINVDESRIRVAQVEGRTFYAPRDNDHIPREGEMGFDRYVLSRELFELKRDILYDAFLASNPNVAGVIDGAADREQAEKALHSEWIVRYEEAAHLEHTFTVPINDRDIATKIDNVRFLLEETPSSSWQAWGNSHFIKGFGDQVCAAASKSLSQITAYIQEPYQEDFSW